MDLNRKIKLIEAELHITDLLLENRNRLLDAIPPCPIHGSQCIPHALDWIEQAKKLRCDGDEETLR